MGPLSRNALGITEPTGKILLLARGSAGNVISDAIMHALDKSLA